MARRSVLGRGLLAAAVVSALGSTCRHTAQATRVRGLASRAVNETRLPPATPASRLARNLGGRLFDFARNLGGRQPRAGGLQHASGASASLAPLHNRSFGGVSISIPWSLSVVRRPRAGGGQDAAGQPDLRAFNINGSRDAVRQEPGDQLFAGFRRLRAALATSVACVRDAPLQYREACRSRFLGRVLAARAALDAFREKLEHGQNIDHPSDPVANIAKMRAFEIVLEALSIWDNHTGFADDPLTREAEAGADEFVRVVKLLESLEEILLAARPLSQIMFRLQNRHDYLHTFASEEMRSLFEWSNYFASMSTYLLVNPKVNRLVRAILMNRIRTAVATIRAAEEIMLSQAAERSAEFVNTTIMDNPSVSAEAA